MMLPQTQLQVDDQVRMIRKVDGLSKGSIGTVVRVLVGTDCYDIQFEGYAWPHLVYHDDLERIKRREALEHV